jgi:hypothetical protein
MHQLTAARKSSVAVLSPRLMRKHRSRERLRKRLFAGFELSGVRSSNAVRPAAGLFGQFAGFHETLEACKNQQQSARHRLEVLRQDGYASQVTVFGTEGCRAVRATLRCLN